jgi:hypothetical protein
MLPTSFVQLATVGFCMASRARVRSSSSPLVSTRPWRIFARVRHAAFENTSGPPASPLLAESVLQEPNSSCQRASSSRNRGVLVASADRLNTSSV